MTGTPMDTVDWMIVCVKILAFVGVWMTLVPLMTWVERRGCALMGNRLGPNRVGPLGLLQPVADGIKFFFKEDPIPAHVEKFYYLIAPAVCLIPALTSFAVIPVAAPLTIGGHTISFQVADLNIGVVYVLAMSSLGVFGIVMAGWSSNNKYSLLGAMRSASQMISYELSLSLSVVAIVMVFSSVHLSDITVAQGELLCRLGPVAIPRWGVLVQPVGFILFLVSMFAETNRLPFDLPEGESEIVAGYHLEYGSMKFATFYMSEYLNMITASALIVTLYFGGWQYLPGFHWLADVVKGWSQLPVGAADVAGTLLQLASFSIKTAFFLWLFVWVRWTLPRFRYDQLMNLGWKVLLPLSLANVFATAVLIYSKVL